MKTKATRPEVKAVPAPTPIGQEPGQARPQRVRLDPVEFFRRFCAHHGNWFVQEEGRLIFSDGWTCAADTYGPYWPPPKDLMQLAELLRRYFRRRRALVLKERDDLAHEMENLQGLRNAMPGELVAARQDLAYNDYGELVGVTVTHDGVPWPQLLERLKWLNGDVLRCDQELNALGER